MLRAGDDDTIGNLLNFKLDPEYFMYEGCICATVSGHRRGMTISLV